MSRIRLGVFLATVVAPNELRFYVDGVSFFIIRTTQFPPTRGTTPPTTVSS